MTENTLNSTRSAHEPLAKPAISATTNAIVLYAAWIQAIVATAGSLYFSEVMMFVPCVLCWYQRILMYPLVLIIGAGMLLRDPRLKFYVLPLSVTGLVIAIYHNLLQYNILAEGITQCRLGASCTTPWINWFGFVSIPLLSLVAFTVITVCMLIYRFNEAPIELVEEEAL